MLASHVPRPRRPDALQSPSADAIGWIPTTFRSWILCQARMSTFMIICNSTTSVFLVGWREPHPDQ
eukprot:scaffold69270_cov22-Cyclotella_meneghiniana.AAC.4